MFLRNKQKPCLGSMGAILRQHCQHLSKAYEFCFCGTNGGVVANLAVTFLDVSLFNFI